MRCRIMTVRRMDFIIKVILLFNRGDGILKASKLKQRIYFLDEVRGFAIICMVFYHLGYLLVDVYSINIPFFYSNWMNILRDFFIALFVFISGCACHFSRNNLKRGVYCVGAGLLITAATWIFMPQQLIVFGILHMLGCCMILYHFLQYPLKKIHSYIAVPLFIALFFFTWNIIHGYLGFPPLGLKLPQQWYTSEIFFIFGITSPSFFSADYFPLFPWLFLFIAGSYIGKSIAAGKWPAFFYKMHCRFLAGTGRYTLIIYLLHQPVLLCILELLFHIIK